MLPPRRDAHVQAGPTLSAVPHLVPRAHVERVRGPWVGGWAQPAVYIRKHVPTQVWRHVRGLCEEGEGDGGGAAGGGADAERGGVGERAAACLGAARPARLLSCRAETAHN